MNCDNFQKNLFKRYGYSPVDKLLMNSSNKFGSINQNFDKHRDDTNSSVDLKDPDIILDFSAVNYIDTNGVKMIEQIIEDFKKCNVFVYICQSQGN